MSKEARALGRLQGKLDVIIENSANMSKDEIVKAINEALEASEESEAEPELQLTEQPKIIERYHNQICHGEKTINQVRNEFGLQPVEDDGCNELLTKV